MKRLVYPFVLACFCAALVACGGCGGGSATTGPVASAMTYQLAAAHRNLLNPGTLNFSISGTKSSGDVATGSGSTTLGPLTPAVFEGMNALQQTSSTLTSITDMGVTTPASTVRTFYRDSNLLSLGSSGDDYQVVVDSSPATATVGSSGISSTIKRYKDSSKATLRGTETESYSLEADTASTALLKVVLVSKDKLGTTLSTATGGLSHHTQRFDHTHFGLC